jgi:segregation and condensation protein B
MSHDELAPPTEALDAVLPTAPTGDPGTGIVARAEPAELAQQGSDADEPPASAPAGPTASAPAGGDSSPVTPSVADCTPGELRAVVEALLFAATRPLSSERIQSCLPGTSLIYLDAFLPALAERYDAEQRGWEMRFVAGGWQLQTRRELHPWVRQLERRDLPTRLSRSALETLSIVAYKQPITRGAIEDIRGVQCGPVLRQLMDLKLVMQSGRDEATLGRPLLYATTDSFLARFGLGSLADLPRRHEFGA